MKLLIQRTIETGQERLSPRSEVESNNLAQLRPLVREAITSYATMRSLLRRSSLPRIVGHATKAIKHLAVEQPTFGYQHRDRIGRVLADLRVQLADDYR